METREKTKQFTSKINQRVREISQRRKIFQIGDFLEDSEMLLQSIQIIDSEN